MDERKNNPRYTFSSGYYNNKPVKEYKKEDVPSFTISDELRAAVYKDMPDDLSPEAKAIFRYYRLCMLLDYDVDFLFRCIWDTTYILEQKKDIVSKIKPNDHVVCGEFSAIYFQFLREIDGVEPVIIETNINENSRHYLNGFYTDNVSLYCEPIDIVHSATYTEQDEQYEFSANDLARVKAGIAPGGISGIFPEDTFPQLMHDVFVEATGMEPVMNYENMFYEAQDIYQRDNVHMHEEHEDDEEHDEEEPEDQSLSELLQEFHEAPETNIPDSEDVFIMRFEAFLEVLRSYGIHDNSAYISFANLDDIGYFGDSTTDTRIGERYLVDGRPKYRRLVILQRGDTPVIYCFDPLKLEISVCDREQIYARIRSGEWIYEKPDEKIKE